MYEGGSREGGWRGELEVRGEVLYFGSDANGEWISKNRIAGSHPAMELSWAGTHSGGT